jgi:hypothetical protein
VSTPPSPHRAGADVSAAVERMTFHATTLSALYFGLPVYLVGSCVRPGAREPNDIDVVIAIPDDLFGAMYGPHGDGTPSTQWMRWARDCAKQSRELTIACGRFVDFRTQPQSVFDTRADQPRRRIDRNINGDEMKTTETVYKCDGVPGDRGTCQKVVANGTGVLVRGEIRTGPDHAYPNGMLVVGADNIGCETVLCWDCLRRRLRMHEPEPKVIERAVEVPSYYDDYQKPGNRATGPLPPPDMPRCVTVVARLLP